MWRDLFVARERNVVLPTGGVVENFVELETRLFLGTVASRIRIVVYYLSSIVINVT